VSVSFGEPLIASLVARIISQASGVMQESGLLRYIKLLSR
jgi:hypothetical protein